MPLEKLINVTCVRCKTEFDGFNEGQAGDCAAKVNGAEIQGNYGSSILDMEVAVFAEGDQHGLPNGTICDACITQLVAEGFVLRPHCNE